MKKLLPATLIFLALGNLTICHGYYWKVDINWPPKTLEDRMPKIRTDLLSKLELVPIPLSQVKTWAYQIQDLNAQTTPDPVEAICNSGYDMMVLDPTVTHDSTFNAASMVRRIKTTYSGSLGGRKLVIAYLDIGEMEEWRWYWGNHQTYENDPSFTCQSVTEIRKWAPWVVTCDPDGWAGCYPVAYWDSNWKGIVIYGYSAQPGPYFKSMMEEVIIDGFDGVYLDWVEAWENADIKKLAADPMVKKNTAQEMLKFIKEIRAFGKKYNPNFIVIQQNSAELINAVGATAIAKAVDGIAQEAVWYDGDATDDWNNQSGYDQKVDPTDTNTYLTNLKKYQAAGLPVFVCEYAVTNAAGADSKAKANGFIPYVTRRPLNRLTTTPPPTP